MSRPPAPCVISYHPNPNSETFTYFGSKGGQVPTNQDPIRRCCILASQPEPARGCPVLYLLHGVGDNEYSWELFGRASSVVDALVLANEIEPVVVVMPFGFVRQELKLTREFPTQKEFADHLDSLIAEVEGSHWQKKEGAREARYPEIDRTRRAIAGLSMGGKQALEFGLEHHRMFEAIGSFSAAIQDRGQGSPAPAVKQALESESFRQSKARLYVSCGNTDETSKGALRAMNTELMKWASVSAVGRVRCEWFAAGHRWNAWTPALREFLKLWVGKGEPPKSGAQVA